MITIQLTNGTLDIPSGVEISLTHTPYRFAESMQDEWTNDFTVPATRHNIQILDCQGLLYANNQRYGSEIKPCTLTINGVMKDARVQVVSMNKDEIQLCLYVAEIPLVLKGKTLRDFFTDDDSTIIPWDKNSVNNYPSWFPTYDYGMPYIAEAAQRHPAKSLNSILMELQNKTGITIQMPDKNYYVVAQHKNVCPQSNHQTVCATYNRDNNMFDIYGSQHITNDLSSDGSNSIEFNRPCHVKATITVSYESDTRVQQNPARLWLGPYTIDATDAFTLYPYQVDVWMESKEIDFWIEEPLQFNFNLYRPQSFKNFTIYAEFVIDDYEITEEDYSTELQYEYMTADKKIWTPPLSSRNGDFVHFVYYDREAGSYVTGTAWLPQIPFAYFGYWANVDNVKITDLLYNIAFMEGKEAVYDAFSNEINFLPTNRIKELKTAEIEEYKPTTDKFAQKNFITFKGQDVKDLEAISKIDSVYLEGTKTLKESIFCINKFYTNSSNVCGGIAQYSNPEYDADSQKFTCDYEDVEGLCLMEGKTEEGKMILYPITIDTNGLEKITSVMEVTMRDRLGTDLTKTDYVYVNGVKIMLTNVNSTLNPNSNENEITGIVVPEQF